MDTLEPGHRHHVRAQQEPVPFWTLMRLGPVVSHIPESRGVRGGREKPGLWSTAAGT